MKTALQLINNDSATVKAGWKTSEFWLHLVYQVLVWVTTLDLGGTHVQQLIGAGLSAAGLLGYTLSRTAVKTLSK